MLLLRAAVASVALRGKWCPWGLPLAPSKLFRHTQSLCIGHEGGYFLSPEKHIRFEGGRVMLFPTSSCTSMLFTAQINKLFPRTLRKVKCVCLHVCFLSFCPSVVEMAALGNEKDQSGWCPHHLLKNPDLPTGLKMLATPDNCMPAALGGNTWII